MRKIDRQMMKRLHGELSEVERQDLEQFLARAPEERARFCELERAWQGLEEPPPTSPNPSLVAEVVERARREGGSEAGWATAPTWVRSGAALAVTLGVALGITLAEVGEENSALPPMESIAFDAEIFEEELFGQPLGMAESWWRALEAGLAADDFTEGRQASEGGSP